MANNQKSQTTPIAKIIKAKTLTNTEIKKEKVTMDNMCMCHILPLFFLFWSDAIFYF